MSANGCLSATEVLWERLQLTCNPNEDTHSGKWTDVLLHDCYSLLARGSNVGSETQDPTDGAVLKKKQQKASLCGACQQLFNVTVTLWIGHFSFQEIQKLFLMSNIHKIITDSELIPTQDPFQNPVVVDELA